MHAYVNAYSTTYARVLSNRPFYIYIYICLCVGGGGGEGGVCVLVRIYACV